MTGRPRTGRLAQWVALVAPVPFLVGIALARRNEGALVAGFLGSVAVGLVAIALGAIAWGRVSPEASPRGLLLWVIFGGGLIAFLAAAALALRNWTF
jgi:hypothetical protein